MNADDSLFWMASKLVWNLLSPSNLLVLGLVIGTLLLIFKRNTAAKWLLVPLSTLSFALMLFPFSDYLMMPLENRFARLASLPSQIDGIVVLGGAEDLTRAQAWRVPELGASADRFVAAAELSRLYPQVPIYFSGGRTDSTPIAQPPCALASEIFKQLNVAQERLILEGQARNTAENFQKLKPLLQQPNGTYLLVTSAFHMPRAVGVARKLQISVIPYPVDYRSNAPYQRQLGMNFYERLKALEPAWKEWLGLTAYYWSGKSIAWFPKPLNHDSSLEIHPFNQSLFLQNPSSSNTGLPPS
ncbi:MAG: YdcF family protein [Thiotrichales bacterium]|nr:YdcF family protein [Thiotrichales bacterium]